MTGADGEQPLISTLKSDSDAISSSSSRVAQDAEILACCCDGESKSARRVGGLENTEHGS